VSFPYFALLTTLMCRRPATPSVNEYSRRLQTPGLPDVATASKASVIHRLGNADTNVSMEEIEEQTPDETAQSEDTKDVNMECEVEAIYEPNDRDNGARSIALSVSDKPIGGFDSEIGRALIQEPFQNVAQGWSSNIAKITIPKVKRVVIQSNELLVNTRTQPDCNVDESSTAPTIHLFPSIPLVEHSDFVGIANNYPEHDENQRRSRALTFQSKISDNELNSAEDGQYCQGYIPISRPLVSQGDISSLGREFDAEAASVQQIVMVPQAPISAFGSVSKRRKSDAIHSGASGYLQKRARMGFNKPSVGRTENKPVSEYLEMSRRGVIHRRQVSINSPLAKKLNLKAGDQTGLAVLSQENPEAFDRKRGPLVRRIVIKAKKTVVLDKIFDPPFPLSPTSSKKRKASACSSSPLYPLDEAVVFGLVDMNMAKPPPPFPKFSPPVKTMTPQPSSSPSRQSQAFQALSTRNHPQTEQLTLASIQKSATEVMPVNLHPQGETILLPTCPFRLESPGSLAHKVQVDIDSSPTRAGKPSGVASPVVPRPSSKRRNPVKSNSPSKYQNRKSFAEELKAAWKTPELSKDCVISYAEEGPWLSAAGNGGVIRQIKSTRPGWFQESEVVFAVRYVLG
jgi:hypothetical protein